MSERTLSIVIDADAETCGECGHRELYGRRWLCKLYREPLSRLYEEPQRRHECLEAEQRALDLGREK